MKSTSIAIVGAGLSGLYAGHLLERQGTHDYVLLEARAALGGRIASVNAAEQSVSDTADTIDRFDLGPTWFWPAYQRQLHRLVDELGLEYFEQFENGDMMVECSSDTPPLRMRGYESSPASMRLIGGMSALVDALRHTLDPTRIITGRMARQLCATPTHIDLHSQDTSGRLTTWRAAQVLLALPPRLAESMIAFAPALPQTLTQQWRATATWMAPQAKYIALYDRSFWREQGLSGAARSVCGPLREIHDASMPGGSAALFGFFGIPAHVRKKVSTEALRRHCRAQLARLFGPQAAMPRIDVIKDWAEDPWTATARDLDAEIHHAEAPATMTTSGPWHGRLIGIASEWSPHFPGYVAGAIEAADLGLQAVTILR